MAARDGCVRAPIGDGRILVWFSCGVPSACAAKLAIEDYAFCRERVEVLYCDTSKYEHPDNQRFIRDVADWLDMPIIKLKSSRYTDIFDVFDRTHYLVGPHGARCTIELKKRVRENYQRADDIHVFGYTTDEQKRVERFQAEHQELYVDMILLRRGLSRHDCVTMFSKAGIPLPAMYRLGYKNNNCIGCVKGGMGYWNKIRRDFPQMFHKMAVLERKLNVSINKTGTGSTLKRVFLDELSPDAGRYVEESSLSCGPHCEAGLCNHEDMDWQYDMNRELFGTCRNCGWVDESKRTPEQQI